MLLGEKYGWLEVLDINTSTISITEKLYGDIIDIIATYETNFLLATIHGLYFFKTTNNEIPIWSINWKPVTSLSHIADSISLVGSNKDGLKAWNQQNKQDICQISDDRLVSIKRVMNSYILRTENRLKLLTIRDLESKKFTIQHLLEVKDDI